MPTRGAPNTLRHRLRPPATRPGLTFLEVMFAVIILGIGLIMTAAIFPVAMQQQQASMDSAQTVATTDSAIATLRVLANQQVNAASPKGPFDTTDTNSPLWVHTFSTNAWTNAVSGSAIDSANPHYAWTALYTRQSGTQSASVILFALASRNHATFESGELLRQAGYRSDLEAQYVNVTVIPEGAPGSNRIQFNSGENAVSTGAACEGAYIVIADGSTAEKIYRLGTLVPASALPAPANTNTWYISPDYDLASSSTSGNPEAVSANAWLLGRGYRDYTNPSQGFSGPCQVIGIRFATSSGGWFPVSINSGF